MDLFSIAVCQKVVITSFCSNGKSSECGAVRSGERRWTRGGRAGGAPELSEEGPAEPHLPAGPKPTPQPGRGVREHSDGGRLHPRAEGLTCLLSLFVCGFKTDHDFNQTMFPGSRAGVYHHADDAWGGAGGNPNADQQSAGGRVSHRFSLCFTFITTSVLWTLESSSKLCKHSSWKLNILLKVWLFLHDVTCRRRILLWDKKTQILKETRTALELLMKDDEIQKTKDDIHHLEVNVPRCFWFIGLFYFYLSFFFQELKEHFLCSAK